MLGSLLVLIINSGILLLYVIDNLANYHNQIRILIFIPILFLAVFKFFPETPEFLQKEGHILVNILKIQREIGVSFNLNITSAVGSKIS